VLLGPGRRKKASGRWNAAFRDDMSIGMAIGRFPYTTSRKLPAPDPVPSADAGSPEPTDDEIAARLGRIAL